MDESIKGLTLHWQAWAGCCFDLLVMLIAQGPNLQGQTTTKITQATIGMQACTLHHNL